MNLKNINEEKSKMTLMTVVGLLFSSAVAFSSPHPGDLDQSFGSNGTVETSLTKLDDFAYATAVYGDGKVLVVGGAAGNSGGGTIGLVRYLPDGSLDKSFGHNGKSAPKFDINDGIRGVSATLQSDGKILVLGRGVYHAVVARYDSDGGVDKTFGENGLISITVGNPSAPFPSGLRYPYAGTILVQGDGHILISYSRETAADPRARHLIVKRFDSSGRIDGGFGDNGTVALANMSFSPDWAGEGGNKMALDGENRLWLVGETGGYLRVARLLLPFGTLDQSFGNGGLTAFEARGRGDSLVLQRDGKAVASGVCHTQGKYRLGVCAVRIDEKGALDASFGDGGRIVISNATLDPFGGVSAIQSDGKLLFINLWSNNSNIDLAGRDRRFGIYRVNSNGSLDFDFGTEGFAGQLLEPDGMLYGGGAVTPDNKLFVVGSGPALKYLTARFHL